ncbi:dephospho-CoA kinase [Agarivorans sp. TSD2052]|uniref:dephospho-CoA kinase n=1 Tax=Agarivorans sp. TSD2052 TaxID=2937286 RepID=UPI00200CF343|nr:dephospho-CoA kinase [Agarivorans sp. TSD2052]UPW17930.1 dephospho-CoA kinase [Agarivorans sp. TSD2052]
MIVGLTGGIASGKSQVSAEFERLGVPVVDADVVARQVVEPGQAALAKIAEHFGKPVLLADGCLNRPALRQIIFQHPSQKQWLNQLLHPLIRQQMQQQLATVNGPYKLLVAPLLLENQLHTLVDRVLVIDVPLATQLNRTIERDKVSEQQAQQIVNSQMSRQDKLAAANDVIVNDSSLVNLTNKVAELHRFYLNLAKSHDS